MRLFRRRPWARSIAVLLLIVAGAGVSHLDKGDRACAPVVVDEHDESKHVFRAPVPVDHAHCAICHWTRLPRSAFAPLPGFQSPFSVGLTIAERAALTHRAPALDRLPARAPPAAL